jgi:hypothetical protein
LALIFSISERISRKYFFFLRRSTFQVAIFYGILINSISVLLTNIVVLETTIKKEETEISFTDFDFHVLKI